MRLGVGGLGGSSRFCWCVPYRSCERALLFLLLSRDKIEGAKVRVLRV